MYIFAQEVRSCPLSYGHYCALQSTLKRIIRCKSFLNGLLIYELTLPKGFVNVRKERRTNAFRNEVLVVPDDVAVIFKTNTNQKTVYIQRKMLNNVIRIFWRCRGSNPGHFTCKANALPLSHIPIRM